MKKLYRVDMTVMVMAENREDALDIGVGNAAPDDFEVYRILIPLEVYRILMPLSVPDGWRSRFPFGQDVNETCGEIIKRQREEKGNKLT